MVNVMLLAALAPAALAVGVFALQIVLASLRPSRQLEVRSTAEPGRLSVVIPAHDEESGIGRTLQSIAPQLREGDRVLVVADNCSDATARVARAHGAAVVERTHDSLHGKGFALAFGVDALRSDPPSLVIFVDADCEVTPGAIQALARMTTATGRPSQARYLMLHPVGASLSKRLAQFAWRVRNWVRPSGWHRIGAPCQLMGSGMCFRWDTLRDAPLAHGSIVEDMQLGIDLAIRGAAPVFCADALVTSAFPDSAAASKTQRTRWEHGHLQMILRSAIPLLWRSLRRADGALALMALDLMVPPLALLAAVLAGLLFPAVGVALVTHVTTAAWVAGISILVFAAAVLQARRAFGRDLVAVAELATIPLYVARKLPMYGRFLIKRQQRWVRTSRDAT